MVLQKKYATPRDDAIPAERRFVCCVDLTVVNGEPNVYVFPAAKVSAGLNYFFSGRFPKSSSYHLSLDFKPQGKTKLPEVKRVGEYIDSESFLEQYDLLGVNAVST
jgi:hypothetical protein